MGPQIVDLVAHVFVPCSGVDQRCLQRARSFVVGRPLGLQRRTPLLHGNRDVDVLRCTRRNGETGNVGVALEGGRDPPAAITLAAQLLDRRVQSAQFVAAAAGNVCFDGRDALLCSPA